MAADEDKKAFGQVASAYGMPKETDVRKVRSEAIAIARSAQPKPRPKVMRAGTSAPVPRRQSHWQIQQAAGKIRT